jgi:nickel/cobalt exporter
MSNELWVLILAAASIGFFHTLFGPDHYLPFIVMSKSGQWSLRKTSLITFLCGLGHVLSSVLLGFVGVAFGIAVTKLEILESFRGNLAAWLLIAFGLVYFIWGARRAWRNKAHHHLHSHKNADDHEHSHSHHTGHVHAHVEKGKKSMTPWVLFTIFIFGPCEPLIPLLMYPAARGGFWNIIIVTGVFAAVTIGTMMSVVLISAFGINFVPVLKLERYTHALAGATIFLCGMSIQFLGL